MKKNKKNLRIFMPGTSYYLWAAMALAILVAILDARYGVPAFLLLVFLFFHSFRSNYKRQKEITSYIENLTFNIESASKDTMLNFPLPLIVVELNGTVVWYNSQSRIVFGDEKLFDKKIDTIIEEFKPDDLFDEEDNISRIVDINYRHYRMLGNFVKTAESSGMGSYILLLYFIDISEQVRLKKKYDDERVAAGVIVIDNYEELMASVENTGPHQLLAEIEKMIKHWLGFTDGIVKKFERDKYFIIFEIRYLKEIKNRKFEILDEVKEIKLGNKIPVTLSIGFGINGNSLIENLNFAGASIDIALARGGDQVVVKDGENLSFFGGRTRELEKRTRVKARVISYALRELIDQSGQVLIMGHENGDIDSLGASLGVFSIARCRNKKAHIVLNKSNASIDRLIRKIKQEYEYEDVFITKSEAMDLNNDEKTLVIVVDTHRPSFTECPQLLEGAGRVVVIDHHRRGAEFIHDPVLIYQEAYSSSTCELVTEILQYIDDKLKLHPIEAEALYAGIVMDTKNFTFKTGVRTFEAASFLRRKGVDTSLVKYLFQNDITTYNSISEVIKGVEVINGSIAVSTVPENIKNQQLISAKAADELLSLSDITTAFVLCSLENQISISGRSFGNLNVQAILEKLGGGGHMTVAGAQLVNESMESAREKLKLAIANYIKENIEEV